MKVLVTGGAGYIGSHTAHRLIRAGHEVAVFDNLSTGFREAVPARAKFVCGDVLDQEKLVSILRDYKIEAVVHFAGKLNVKESHSKPDEYYANNSLGVLSLTKAMGIAGVAHVVFSSSAAIFGEGISGRGIQEDDRKEPLSPYGLSKLMSEDILEQASVVGEINYCALRYFNVAGASADGSNGQRTAEPFHLIHLGVQTALGQRPRLQIFGTDYPTPDGTCVRDYIHVEDLADLHLLALEYLVGGGKTKYFNCGYGRGYSVRTVVQTIQKISGTNFSVIESERRDGDPAALVADSSLVRSELGWVPQRDDLELICRDAYDWEKNYARPMEA